MSSRTWCILAIVAASLLPGCASQRKSAVATRSPSASPATNEVTVGPSTQPVDAKANLTLDQIQPAPQPPTTRPDLANAPKPPLEALELYARARDALASGHQFTAISALERAIKLDPNSAELHRLASRAYLKGGNTNKAIESLSRAVQLEPDDLRSQTALARLYLQRGSAAEAIDHLRLGLQTDQYTKDEAAAGIADYFLAKALQQQGYERAALDQYEKLLNRLSRRSYELRTDAELSDWASRPQAIYSDVARLYEKRRDYRKALDAWQHVAALDSDDLDVRQRVIEMLLALDQRDEALHEAVTLVRETSATSRSLEILRDTARRVGREQAVFDELARLQEERPGDRPLLFARVDLLTTSGRDAEALAALQSAARIDFDIAVVRRLVFHYLQRSQSIEAAKLLIEASASRPDDTQTFLLMFATLLSPQRADVLRGSDVQAIVVPPYAEAAKSYFTVFAAGSREILARESLDRAVAADPIFPPALRLAMIRLGQRNDLDGTAKTKVANDLIAQAERANMPAFVHELRAYEQLSRSQYKEALEEFERSFKLAPLTAQPALHAAGVYHGQGNNGKFQQTLQRLTNDQPMHHEAYVNLIDHYTSRIDGNNNAAAVNVLQRWRSADPTGALPRAYEATLRALAGQSRDATQMLVDLLKENPHDPAVFRAATLALETLNKPLLVQTLDEQLATTQPKNGMFVLKLIDSYQGMNKPDDVQRVADRAREAANGDARQLYLVASIYTSIDQKEKSRAALEESYRLDPNDPTTNNDLGYTWAEEGINLDRAEKMTQLAVQAEPDNSSFLDSLGWVYYKLGRFTDARKHLEAAVTVSSDGDPVSYDHLGDTLYRLNDLAGAQTQWNKALQLLVTGQRRPDINTLRPVIEQKIQQAQMGRTVNVARTAKDEGGRMKDEVGKKDEG